MIEYLYLIPLLPLAGLALNLAFGARWGHRGVGVKSERPGE